MNGTTRSGPMKGLWLTAIFALIAAGLISLAQPATQVSAQALTGDASVYASMPTSAPSSSVNGLSPAGPVHPDGVINQSVPVTVASYGVVSYDEQRVVDSASRVSTQNSTITNGISTTASPKTYGTTTSVDATTAQAFGNTPFSDPITGSSLTGNANSPVTVFLSLPPQTPANTTAIYAATAQDSSTASGFQQGTVAGRGLTTTPELVGSDAVTNDNITASGSRTETSATMDAAVFTDTAATNTGTEPAADVNANTPAATLGYLPIDNTNLDLLGQTGDHAATNPEVSAALADPPATMLQEPTNGAVRDTSNFGDPGMGSTTAPGVILGALENSSPSSPAAVDTFRRLADMPVGFFPINPTILVGSFTATPPDPGTTIVLARLDGTTISMITTGALSTSQQTRAVTSAMRDGSDQLFQIAAREQIQTFGAAITIAPPVVLGSSHVDVFRDTAFQASTAPAAFELVSLVPPFSANEFATHTGSAAPSSS